MFELDAEHSSEVSIFGKSYHPIYQFVNDHEYMLTPLAGAMAGGILCGPWCALGGAMLGIIDETLVQYEFTKNHHLTWGLLGATSGNVISPSVASGVIGGLVGVSLSTGLLIEHTELIAPTISAIAGNSVAGTLGLVGGGILGIMDEMLIHTDIISNHYMTSCTVGVAAVNLLKWFNPTVSISIGVALGAIAISYEEDLSTSWAPIKTTKELYEMYCEFIPRDQLNNHIEKHTLALVSTQFITQYLALRSTEYRQGLIYNFERLDNTGTWGIFRSKLFDYGLFLIPYMIGNMVAGRVDGYFSDKLQFEIEDRVRSELFSDEIALRMSHESNSTVLMDLLSGDVSTITGSGSMLITGAISSCVDGVYGVGIVINNSPNIFLYTVLYTRACSYISNYLTEQRRGYNERISVLGSEILTVMKHDTENIRTITERGGITFTRNRLQRLHDTSRTIEAKKEIWSSVSSLWWSVSGISDFIVNYYLVGNEINQGRMPFDSRTKVQIASWQLSSLLSWTGHNAQLVSTIDQSLDRVTTLKEKVRDTSIGVDQITRIARTDNQLVLQDLVIDIEGRELVSIESLELEMGKVYAITGETGCGKTSLLSKIRGIKENKIGGRGNIYYPRIAGGFSKILMLSQQDYFPTKSSLQEVILYPDETPSDPVLYDEMHREMQALLDEIGLHSLKVEDKEIDLKTEKDWYTALSGGEKKRLLVVSAIIKKPDILILDEAFNGLDPRSVKIVQQMLKKYLPNTLILIVDHHARDNNYDEFYSQELRVTNKRLFLRNTIKKPPTPQTPA